jgi:hypothetical protein
MTINQSNIPSNINISEFIRASDRAGSFAKGCRFFVRIDPPALLAGTYPRDLSYMCEAAALPGRGFGVTDVRYYGPNQQFPNNTAYEPASLSFLCRTTGIERKFFDDWMDKINPTTNFNFEYAVNYYCNIWIYQLAEYGASGSFRPGNSANQQKPLATYCWRLLKAWPTLINPQEVTWGEQDVLRLQVTFAYKYWQRVN